VTGLDPKYAAKIRDARFARRTRRFIGHIALGRAAADGAARAVRLTTVTGARFHAVVTAGGPAASIGSRATKARAVRRAAHHSTAAVVVRRARIADGGSVTRRVVGCAFGARDCGEK